MEATTLCGSTKRKCVKKAHDTSDDILGWVWTWIGCPHEGMGNEAGPTKRGLRYVDQRSKFCCQRIEQTGCSRSAAIRLGIS